MQKRSWFAGIDIAFVVVLIFLIAARWIDFLFADPTLTTGEVAKASQIRNHSIFAAVLGSVAWLIDLAGRNVLEAVQTSVYPKVIDCPPRGRGTGMLEAVARNGIQLKDRARVTVRANAEGRRAMAVAIEQEQMARIEGVCHQSFGLHLSG